MRRITGSMAAAILGTVLATAACGCASGSSAALGHDGRGSQLARSGSLGSAAAPAVTGQSFAGQNAAGQSSAAAATRAAAASGSSQTAPQVSADASAGAQPGNTKLMLIDQSSRAYDWATVAPRYAAINLNDWNTNWISQIRSANPQAKILVYKDLTSTREDDCGTNPAGGSPCIVSGTICPPGTNDAPYFAGGLGFCAAWRANPAWFLTTSGALATASTPPSQLVSESGFPTQYMMDYGNAGYQRAWLSAVKADAQAHGWSGVLADNAISKAAEYGRNGNPASPRYPSDSSAQAAMAGMLSVVGPGLTGAGISIVPNLGYNNLYPGLWAAWLQNVSGLMDEWSYFWPGNGSEGSASSAWGPWMEPEVRACAAAGKQCFFHFGDHSQALTAAQASFALASYLLYADGNSFIEFAGDGPNDPQTALGAATGSATQDASGVWTRHFTNGVVTVNPAAGTGSVTSSPGAPGPSPSPPPSVPPGVSKPTVAPGNLTRRLPTATSAVVGWSAVKGATAYRLQLWKDASGFLISKQVSKLSYRITGLLPHTYYGWRVAAVNAAGTGPWAADHSFITRQ